MRYQRCLCRMLLACIGLGAGMFNWVQMPFVRAQGIYAQPLSGKVHQNQYGANADQYGANAEQGGQDNVMIILDSSYSMSEPIGDENSEEKMTAAKRTVLAVLQHISPNTQVGLRIYGNSANIFTACSATEVLVPLGLNNRYQIASKVAGITPIGSTPISYTLEHSLAEDFNHVQGRKNIVLVSDGMETCGEDPCNVAVRMQQMGTNIKISVVGFGLQDYDAIKQLKCIALATKGQYYTANTSAELANSLNKVLSAETKVRGMILPTTSDTSSKQLPSLRSSR